MKGLSSGTSRAVRRGVQALSFTALLSLGTAARASDPATAQALFDQARRLMAQEKWAEACPKLEESQRLDPGGGTLLHLALCREHEGKIATAWAHYQDALAAAKRDARKDRAKIAQARIDALAPRLPRMRVRVASKNSKLPGFRVTRDEANVGDAQWGEAIPVDPGTRTIAAHADGYKPWSSKVDVPNGPGETAVDVPELEAEPVAAPTAAVATDPDDAAPAIPAGYGDAQRTLGIVLAGIGVAGLIGGSVFGLMSISKNNEANQQCRPNDPTRCNQAGKTAGDDAILFGNISTVAFIAGAALVAGGAILYFTAPRRVVLTSAVTPTGGGLSLRASF